MPSRRAHPPSFLPLVPHCYTYMASVVVTQTHAHLIRSLKLLQRVHACGQQQILYGRAFSQLIVTAMQASVDMLVDANAELRGDLDRVVGVAIQEISRACQLDQKRLELRMERDSARTEAGSALACCSDALRARDTMYASRARMRAARNDAQREQARSQHELGHAQASFLPIQAHAPSLHGKLNTPAVQDTLLAVPDASPPYTEGEQQCIRLGAATSLPELISGSMYLQATIHALRQTIARHGAAQQANRALQADNAALLVGGVSSSKASMQALPCSLHHAHA